MAHFIVRQGEQTGEKFNITGNKALIGRGNQCGIQVTERSVSRSHASVMRQPDGSFVIQDEGSTYGTFVNGEKINQTNLTDGATVKLGGLVLEFVHKQAPASRREEVPDVPTAVEEATGNYTILHAYSDGPEVEGAAVKAAAGEASSSMEDLASANRRLNTAYEISEAISLTFDLAELYQKILQAIFDAIKVERAAILLVDEQSDQIKVQASMDAQGNEKEVPFSRTIVKQVIRDGHSLLLENAQDAESLDSAASVFAHNIRSAICVPIRTREKIIGALNADASGAALFSMNDLHLFTLIGNQAGIVIQNVQLIEENIRAARLAAVGQTVASLAHCIKNILQGLKGGVFMVDEGLNGDDFDMITAAWPLVKGSQQRITELVMNMLDYSKERKPAYQRADLRENMQNIRDLMVDRAEEKDVEIEFEYSDDTPEVQCDPMGIYRAALNLVTNAIDAAQEGGGKVRMEIVPSPDKKELYIRVHDNGPGIAPDVLKKLFEAFHSTKDSKGTGLGLAVSKKIANEHKGDIEVETEVGKGTTFTLVVPVDRPA